MAQHTPLRTPAMPIKAQATIVAQLRRAAKYDLCTESTIEEAVRVINIPTANRSPVECAFIRELSRILSTLGDIEG